MRLSATFQSQESILDWEIKNHKGFSGKVNAVTDCAEKLEYPVRWCSTPAVEFHWSIHRFLDFRCLVELASGWGAHFFQTVSQMIRRSANACAIKTSCNHGDADFISHIGVDDSTEDQIDIGMGRSP